MSIDLLKDRLPEYARDLKLNLSSLASEQLLSPQQKAGSFIAAALAANHAPTTLAVTPVGLARVPWTVSTCDEPAPVTYVVVKSPPAGKVRFARYSFGHPSGVPARIK